MGMSGQKRTYITRALSNNFVYVAVRDILLSSLSVLFELPLNMCVSGELSIDLTNMGSCLRQTPLRKYYFIAALNIFNVKCHYKQLFVINMLL